LTARSAYLLCCVGLICLAGSVRAESPGALLGQRVVSVELQGVERAGLSRNEALSYVEIRPGDRFSIQLVRRSVKLLYHLGVFGQVRVVARHTADGVALVFDLEQKRKVTAVEVYGCEVLDEDELRRLSRLSRGDEYDHWRMEAGALDMLGLYAKVGYRRARIVSKAETEAGGDVVVRHFVQEGPPTRISRIWFRGHPAFAESQLLGVMGLKRGDVLDARKLEAAVEALREFYRRNKHLEARVIEPQLETRLEAMWEVVPIEIQAGPQVEFRFVGNQIFNSKSLLKALAFEPGAELNEYALADLRDALANHYRAKGFARVEVASRVRIDSARGRKWVTFFVQEGPRVAVRAVDFVGNQAFGDEQLQGYVFDAMVDALPQSGLVQPVDPGDMDPLGGSHPLRNKTRRVNRPQGGLFELVPETIYLREPYQKALDAIEDLYLSQGYLEVEIGSALLSYDDSGANLYISVPIREGPHTVVDSISFSGNQALRAEELLVLADRLERFVKPGGPLDQYGVEMLRKELLRTYGRQGYVFCRIEQQVEVSPDRSQAEVLYQIEEGPQVRVGRVLVRGNLVTDQKVFDTVVQLKPGQLFSPDLALASQEELQLLGVFNGVDVKMLDPDLVEPVKDVVVRVRERLPHSLSVAPGMSSGEGVRMSVEYIHRNLFGYALESVTRAKANYQVFYSTPLVASSLGQRYEQMSFAEGLEWKLMSGLHWPRMWFLGSGLAGRIDVVGLRDHAPSFDLTKVSVTPGLDFKWSQDLSFSLEYELEYIDLACPFTSSGEPCGGSTSRWLRYDEGTLPLGSLRPELSWDRRDNPFRPHKGSLVFLRTELAHTLDPDRPVYFLKLDGLVSGYFPISRRTTLAVSARAGGIIHLTGDSRTPSHKLFYLGGRNTVRSFSEENLIPADQDPPCILRTERPGQKECVSAGGNFYLVLKGEFRFPLFTDLLEGALFVDVGNLWVEAANVDPFDLRPAAGLGLRLATPVGPLAFDLAFNLMPDESRGEGTWNLHFNVGVF
jgi:outer membrane protein assembly complex protein YaeT